LGHPVRFVYILSISLVIRAILAEKSVVKIEIWIVEAKKEVS